jgi:YfiR/HmsC-like
MTTPSSRRSLPARFAAFCITCFLLVTTASPVRSQSTGPSEYELKAAFLINFAKFIDWPETSFVNPESPFRICVIGQDPFGHVLDAYLARNVDTHPVQIVHIPNTADLSAARDCHIAFISASEKGHFRDVIQNLHGTDTLLVGDAEGFAASGGTIEFILEDNHIRFAINTDSAERANLKVSSKLLALAKIVHDDHGGGKS